MEIKIRTNAKLISKKLKKLMRKSPRAIRAALGKTAEFAKAGIVKRTLEKSQDAFMRPLAPYSEAYAKFKGSTKVNLKVSGQMWSSLTTKADARTAKLFFLGEPQEYAAYQHFGIRRGGKISKPRPFFALSDRQQKEITNIFSNEFRKRFHL